MNITAQKRLQEGSCLFFNTPADFCTQRLDVYIKTQLPLYSRTFLSSLITQRAISINGVIATKASTLVKGGNQITITIPVHQAPKDHKEQALLLPVTILYTHEQFFIINKPAPLTVHPLSSAPEHTIEPTLIDWIKAYDAHLAQVGDIDRPGIIHRLDKETSGLMIIPRTNYAYQLFSELFKNRLITKKYLALVQGHPKESGSIEYDIGRHPIIRTRMRAYKPGEIQQTPIRNALTHYRILSYFNDYSLVEAHIITGRTHQIRVHFAAIGNPVIGDHMYGSRSTLIQRQALHATYLSFVFEGTPFTFTQDPPEDFKKLCS